MSYDLMVFEPEAAPKDHGRFLEWYSAVTEWTEGHSYDDPAVTSARLRSWLSDMEKSYPSMDGPEAEVAFQENEGVLTSYTIGKQFVYACFAWSQAERAYKTMFALAEKHGVAFFDVSSTEEEVWMPSEGKLSLAHKKKAAGLWNRWFGSQK